MLHECTLLYVEDDPVIRQLITQLLSPRVKAFYTAGNGKEGLEAYKKLLPDIVISDIKMPFMDGLEMASEIRKLNPLQHILIFTAFDDIEVLKRSISIGVNGFEEKPITNVYAFIGKLEVFASQIDKSRQLKKVKNEIEIKNSIIDKHLLVTLSDLDGVIVEVSQAMLQITGYSKEELIGKNHSILGHNDKQQANISALWDALENNHSWSGEIENRKKNGESFWVDAIIEPLFDEDGKKYGYLAIKHNITDKKRVEFLAITDSLTALNNRRQFNQIFANEFEKAQEFEKSFGFILMDIDYFKKYNDYYGHPKGDQVLKQIGATLNRLAGKGSDFAFRLGGEEFAMIVSGMSESDFEAYCYLLLEQIKALQIAHVKSKVSDVVTVSLGGMIVPAQTEIEGGVDELYAQVDKLLYKAKQEGRDRAKILSWGEKVLYSTSVIDSLTKLPVRESLLKALANPQEEKLLMIINISNFEQIKRYYGFDICDKMLLELAKSYRKITQKRGASTLFRLNISEFAILVYNKPDFDNHILMMQHYIIDNSCCTFEDNDEEKTLFVTHVVGLATGTHDLLNKADIALKQANRLNRTFFIYDENTLQMDTSMEKVHNLNVYKDALENNRIIPYFQPIVDAKTKQVYKYEALARLIDRNGNTLSPYLFLESSKADRTSEFMTRQLLQKIFNIYGLNQNLQLSINLTYENITTPTLVDYIINRMEKFGGDGITFEIIESEDIEDYEKINAFIELIRKYGCRFAIDDFGSGYSNLAHLMKLNPDYLKLDGSLIQNIDTDAKSERIVRSLLSYTKATGNKVVAEFVSSQSISDKAEELGIDLLQGFHYGKPEKASFYGLKEAD